MTKTARIQILTEIISALAVVITLIFLLVEIRQNTEQSKLNARAVEIAAYQDLISQIHDINSLFIENPDFSELLVRFNNGETLTESEENQISRYCWSLIRHGDMAYYQYERGAITEERLLAALGPLNEMRVIPQMRDVWDRRRDGLAEGYQNYIDHYFAEHDRSVAAKETKAAVDISE